MEKFYQLSTILFIFITAVSFVVMYYYYRKAETLEEDLNELSFEFSKLARDFNTYKKQHGPESSTRSRRTYEEAEVIYNQNNKVNEDSSVYRSSDPEVPELLERLKKEKDKRDSKKIETKAFVSKPVIVSDSDRFTEWFNRMVHTGDIDYDNPYPYSEATVINGEDILSSHDDTSCIIKKVSEGDLLLFRHGRDLWLCPNFLRYNLLSREMMNNRFWSSIFDVNGTITSMQKYLIVKPAFCKSEDGSHFKLQSKGVLKI